MLGSQESRGRIDSRIVEYDPDSGVEERYTRLVSNIATLEALMEVTSILLRRAIEERSKTRPEFAARVAQTGRMEVIDSQQSNIAVRRPFDAVPDYLQGIKNATTKGTLINVRA